MSDHPAFSFTSEADAYVWGALFAISVATDASELRAWWGDEAGRRESYGLSDDQIQQLIDASKQKIAELGDTPQSDPRPKARPKRKRAAI